jgi:hypothetical protein
MNLLAIHLHVNWFSPAFHLTFTWFSLDYHLHLTCILIAFHLCLFSLLFHSSVQFAFHLCFMCFWLTINFSFPLLFTCISPAFHLHFTFISFAFNLAYSNSTSSYRRCSCRTDITFSSDTSHINKGGTWFPVWLGPTMAATDLPPVLASSAEETELTSSLSLLANIVIWRNKHCAHDEIREQTPSRK